MVGRWKALAFRVGTVIAALAASAAVIFAVLWVSSNSLGTFSSNPENRFAARTNTPFSSPLQTILAHYPKATKLQQWAQQWQAAAADAKPNSDFQLEDLQNLIQKSDVSAADRLRIATLVNKAGDANTAAISARSGVFKADAELANMPTDSPAGQELRRLLIPLEEPLTRQLDPQTMERFWALQIPIPRQDGDDQQPEWRRICHAQWLIYSGQAVAALAEINSIKTDAGEHSRWYTPDELAELTWLEGLALYRNGDSETAKPLLVETSSEGGAHATEAASILAEINMPANPLEFLRNCHPRLEKLQTWAARWQSSDVTAQPNIQDLNDLSALISESSLSALDQLTIAQLVFKRGEPSTAQIWVNAAISAAENELAPLAHNDKRALPLMDALERLSKSLWHHNPYSHGAELERISAMLMRFDPSGPWDQRREWARISYAESMLMQRNLYEAWQRAVPLSADASKPGSPFTEQQRFYLLWVRSEILHQAGYYEKAIPLMRLVLSNPRLDHPEWEWPSFINDLCQTHQLSEARQALKEYAKQCKPSSSEISNLSDQIAVAESQPEHSHE